MKALAAVAAAGAAVALPGAADAGPRADYRQVFTTARPGVSTGIDTQILYKHPDDPDAKPIPIRQEIFTFPRGTRFDGAVVPDCAVSDEQLRIQGESACPEETRIVTGHDNTSMTGFPGAGETPIVVNGFDYGGGRFRVLGQAEGFPLRYVAHGQRVGRVTTIEIPQTPGGPPDGQGALRRIHNISPARSAGRRAAVRTPRTCPRSGVWTFKVRMTFADGAVERNVHRMPCKRRAPGGTRT
jgi:hypothetical protein